MQRREKHGKVFDSETLVTHTGVLRNLWGIAVFMIKLGSFGPFVTQNGL